MNNASCLHCQQNQQLFGGRGGRFNDTEVELLRPSDHLPKQLIHGIGVHAGTIRDARAQMRPHATQEPRGRRRLSILWLVGKDATQVLVVVGGPVPGKVFALFRVVLT